MTPDTNATTAQAAAREIWELIAKADWREMYSGKCREGIAAIIAKHYAPITQDRDQLKAQLAESQKTIRGLKDSIHEHIAADSIRGREIQQLRAQLEAIASYANTARIDPSRIKSIDGEVYALQTLDWCQGLLEQVRASDALLHATCRKGEKEKV